MFVKVCLENCVAYLLHSCIIFLFILLVKLFTGCLVNKDIQNAEITEGARFGSC